MTSAHSSFDGETFNVDAQAPETFVKQRDFLSVTVIVTQNEKCEYKFARFEHENSTARDNYIKVLYQILLHFFLFASNELKSRGIVKWQISDRVQF